MVDMQQYWKYMQFLSGIHAKNKVHYVIDDRIVKDGSAIETLKGLGVREINGICRYDSYPRNQHHWTTSFVWSSIIPMVSRDLEIPFDENDFIFCRNFRDGHDLSFHNPKGNPEVTLEFDGIERKGRFNDVVMAVGIDGKDIEKSQTGYHSLFIPYHKCCIVQNESMKGGRVLMINTDSMSIPVIPVLIGYFKRIYVLDNRKNEKWVDEHVDFSQITDYVALSLTRSYAVLDDFQFSGVSNNKIFRQNIA